MTTIDETPAAVPESLETWWKAGLTWGRYLADEIVEHRGLWEGVYRKSVTPDWVLAALAERGRNWKLIAIAEDWCADSSDLLPIFARLAEDSPRIDLRIVKRDEHPELMDMYLTDGTRSIPIVVVMDEALRPVGRWGPRPADLQEVVLREKRAGEWPDSEIYEDARRWYARDHGETTLREVLAVMAEAG